MSPHRRVVSVCVVAVAALGLSACSGSGSEQPTGLKPFTPTPSSHTASPVAVPSPTSASKWTPEQQKVIETASAYHVLVSRYGQGTNLDMAALRKVATDPFALRVGKNIVNGLSLGFILHGDDVHQVRAVTINGPKSTLTECWIEHSYATNKKMSPPVRTKSSPPHIVKLTLTRSATKWRVAGFTDGAACAAKG